MTDDGVTESEQAGARGKREGGIQVLVRASRILRVLGVHPDGLSLGEIAQRVELPRSTVQRIVNSLTAENILESAGAGGGVRLGPALGQLAYQSQADIVSTVRPYLERLARALDETVCLSQLRAHDACIIDFVVGEQSLRIVPKLGMNVPIHLGAEGKALLAAMGEAGARTWLEFHADAVLPDRTLLPSLLAELAQVRQAGFAVDDGRCTEGISAIAATVQTYRGPYALTVVAPSARMQARRAEYLRQLKATLAAIRPLVGAPAARAGDPGVDGARFDGNNRGVLPTSNDSAIECMPAR
ncbi:IclR family transcriptional regulator [Propionivibrio dicarboxylicus]|uniref:Transcriptional regulator, IclR family n=1 Tax=Propionivibrio dicarboxylicus TaxID=83767 RepID=A0A1G8HZH1_9RHOO|nr:IclR family transcriptional regulator [Propionivibrio dicarboxylicus]SDI12033.1 transcriptional regulator, IclR family [Propionivibrio dicarboxylicus]